MARQPPGDAPAGETRPVPKPQPGGGSGAGTPAPAFRPGPAPASLRRGAVGAGGAVSGALAQGPAARGRGQRSAGLRALPGLGEGELGVGLVASSRHRRTTLPRLFAAS